MSIVPDSWARVRIKNEWGSPLHLLALHHRYDRNDSFSYHTEDKLTDGQFGSEFYACYWTGVGRTGYDYWQIYFEDENCDVWCCKTDFYCYLTNKDKEGLVEIKLYKKDGRGVMEVCPPSSGSAKVALENRGQTGSWMSRIDRIQNESLSKIMLPGCHDAGTFAVDRAMPFIKSERKNFPISYVVDGARTQGVSVLAQLLNGVRYFDLRVATMPLPVPKKFNQNFKWRAKSSPVVSDGYAFFQGTDNHLWKVSIENNEPQYEFSTASPRQWATNAAPFLSEGYIYFQGTDNKLWKISADKGVFDQNFTLNGGTGMWQAKSRPFVIDGFCYFQGTDDKLWKVSIYNGKADDKLKRPDGNFWQTKASPFVCGDYIYFQGTDDKLWKVNIHTGASDPALKLSSSEFWHCKSTPAVYDEHVFFQGTDDRLWKVNINDGKAAGSFPVLNTKFAPVVLDASLFSVDTDGFVNKRNCSDGELVDDNACIWKTQTPPIAGNDHICFAGLDNTAMVCKNPEVHLWLYHSLYCVSLQRVLDEVKMFADRHPGEAVILDMSHFSGKVPAALTALLSKYAFSLPPAVQPDSTLASVCKDKHQILINVDQSASDHDAVPGVWHQKVNSPWGNKFSVDELEAFIATTLPNTDAKKIFVTQCQLSISDIDYIVTDPYKIRYTCVVVWDWLKHRPDMKNQGINVVQLDFVEETSLASDIIKINKNPA